VWQSLAKLMNRSSEGVASFALLDHIEVALGFPWSLMMSDKQRGQTIMKMTKAEYFISDIDMVITHENCDQFNYQSIQMP
jgi:hypothetical protein